MEFREDFWSRRERLYHVGQTYSWESDRDSAAEEPEEATATEDDASLAIEPLLSPLSNTSSEQRNDETGVSENLRVMYVENARLLPLASCLTNLNRSIISIHGLACQHPSLQRAGLNLPKAAEIVNFSFRPETIISSSASNEAFYQVADDLLKLLRAYGGELCDVSSSHIQPLRQKRVDILCSFLKSHLSFWLAILEAQY